MFNSKTFQIPDTWLKIQTIEMHTGGEPLRVILDGFPSIQGENVLDYRRYIRDHYDHLRTALMFEPRGHADMYGVIVTPSKVADFGVVFIHNEGYSTMCGHATIAIAKLAVEAGWIPISEPETSIKIEAPCGILTAWVTTHDGQVQSIRFRNIPSFVVALDQKVELPGVGTITYDLAYGGAYYAFVESKELGLELTPEGYRELIELGTQVKAAGMQSTNISHPTEPDLSFLYGTIFAGEPLSPGMDSRNVCVFADGEVDRSPTGSGVSARAAIHYEKDELKVGVPMKIESILGTNFTVEITELVDFHGIPAVIPEVSGTAYITGKNTFTIDPEDPLHEGFILR